MINKLLSIKFLFALFIPLLSLPVNAQKGFISAEHQEKIDRRSSQETKMYAKSEYQVYSPSMNLEEAILEYYTYHFTEIQEGVRMYATPTAMSREKTLDQAVESGRIKAKNSALGVMQLYFYSWINVDERTSQEQKDELIGAAGRAEPQIKEMIDNMDPIKTYVFYKELKRDFRVETRTVYDQELLKEKIRALIIGHLDNPQLFKEGEVESFLIFEK